MVLGPYWTSLPNGNWDATHVSREYLLNFATWSIGFEFSFFLTNFVTGISIHRHRDAWDVTMWRFEKPRRWHYDWAYTMDDIRGIMGLRSHTFCRRECISEVWGIVARTFLNRGCPIDRLWLEIWANKSLFSREFEVWRWSDKYSWQRVISFPLCSDRNINKNLVAILSISK